MKRVVVIDDFLKDPSAEREKALKANYKKSTVHRGQNYPGIAIEDDAESEDKIRSLMKVEGGAFTTFYRTYPPTEPQGTFIHNDVLIGQFSGILFLNDPKDCKGGVAFWKHKLYGWELVPRVEELAPMGLRDTPELWRSVLGDGLDEFKWQMVDYVPMEFNRLILFLSPRFHSRYPFALPGHRPENWRLIKTFFYWPDKAGPEETAT